MQHTLLYCQITVGWSACFAGATGAGDTCRARAAQEERKTSEQQQQQLFDAKTEKNVRHIWMFPNTFLMIDCLNGWSCILHIKSCACRCMCESSHPLAVINKSEFLCSQQICLGHPDNLRVTAANVQIHIQKGLIDESMTVRFQLTSVHFSI